MENIDIELLDYYQEDKATSVTVKTSTGGKKKKNTRLEYIKGMVRDTVCLFVAGAVLTGIVTVIMFVFYLFQGGDGREKITIQSNLVNYHYATETPFAGTEFTPELIAEIEDGNIDPYGVCIVSTYYYDTEDIAGCYLMDGKDAISGTADKLQVTSLVFVPYTQEYAETYYVHPEECPAGYWNITIGLK